MRMPLTPKDFSFLAASAPRGESGLTRSDVTARSGTRGELVDEQHGLVDEPTASLDERPRQRRQELVPKIGVMADDLIAVDRVRAEQRTHEPPDPLRNVGALL